jgi:periplasmic divalent cation tolerance protein
MHPILVTTTCDQKEIAEKIAENALQNRLAACVQVLGPVQSSYWWNDTIASDNEFLIQLKSERALFDELARLIRSLHPYDVPEIIATDICLAEPEYLEWMQKELDG